MESENKKIGETAEEEMSFLGHLEALRWHIVRSAIAVIILAIVAFFFKHIIFDKIALGPKYEDFFSYRAMCALGHKLSLGDALCFGSLNLNLQSISMTTQITMHIMVSIVAGFILAFPYIFYQAWSFIKPALKDNERKSARGMTFWVSFLFILGVLFGYFLIVPISVQFLGNYQVSELVVNNITVNSFVSTVTTLTLATGVLFQLPILMLLLTKIGLVTPDILKKYRRHTIVAVVIVAAIITPPDVTSQILVAIPIIFLYEIGIIISRRTLKKMDKKRADQ